MRDGSEREIMDLQKSIQEKQMHINDIYAYIGKMYYEQTEADPAPDYIPHFQAIKDTMAQLKQIETRIKFLNGIVVCTNCGMDNGVQSTFCAGCGTRLPHTFVQDGANRCAKCGNILNPGQRFCGNCGAEVENVPEEAPAQTPVEEQAAFCPNCGAKIEDKDSVFCSECGTKLN